MLREFLEISTMQTKNEKTLIDRQVSSHDAEAQTVASILISKHRDHLDWALMLPQWEDLVDAALEQLNLKAARQGIGRKRALLALPIETKRDAIKFALERAPNRLPTGVAIKLASLWGVYVSHRNKLENRLNASQWNELKRRVCLRISIEHRKYKSAQNLLYQEYSDLASKVAIRVCLDPTKRDDCLQEARFALIKAIDHIQPKQSFGAYASQWIERHVRNYLIRNKLPISAPINLISQALVARASNGDPPKNLALLFNALEQSSFSIDELDFDKVDHESDSTLADDTPDKAAARSDMMTQVNCALQRLTRKQREIIHLKFGPLANGSEPSNQEIGEAMGITGQQVGRRQKRALAHLAQILSPLVSELA